MKTHLRQLFGFILNPLESGDQEFQKNPLGRKILIVMGCLFAALGSSVVVVVLKMESLSLGSMFPGVVFITAGLFCLIVGCLGSDRAVAKVWGGR